MMRTVLVVAQEVRKSMGLSVPSSIASVSDSTEQQLVNLIQLVSEDLRTKGPFRQQIQTYEFDTVTSQATYDLPGDFYEAVPRTYYNQDTDWQLLGPLTDGEFAAYKEGELYIPTEYVWRIRGFNENTASTEGRQIELYPTPSAAENLVFDYVSGHLYVPPNWAASTAYSSGGYVNVNGRIYLCDTNGTSGATPPSGTDNNQSDGTTQWDHYNQPYEVLGSDSDFCLFDADLIKAGLRWLYYEEKGSPLAAKCEAIYYDRIRSMKYRFEGQSRAFGDRRRSLRGGRHRPYVSPGSWTWS